MITLSTLYVYSVGQRVEENLVLEIVVRVGSCSCVVVCCASIIINIFCCC